MTRIRTWRNSRRNDDDSHWLGIPVQTFHGPIEGILEHIAEFDRRPFAALGKDASAAGVSPYYDVIVRDRKSVV